MINIIKNLMYRNKKKFINEYFTMIKSLFYFYKKNFNNNKFIILINIIKLKK